MVGRTLEFNFRAGGVGVGAGAGGRITKSRLDMALGGAEAEQKGQGQS